MSYHHRNPSGGMDRQGYAKEECDVVSTSECITRPMNDEDHAHLMALLNRRRSFNGVRYSDNPNEQSKGETPHDDNQDSF